MNQSPLENWCAKSPDSAAKELARLRRFVAKHCSVTPGMSQQEAKVVEAAKAWATLPEAAEPIA